MKKNILFLIFIFNVGISFSQNANFCLTLSLDSVLSSVDQWCYLHSYSENEHLIADSVRIEKGSRIVTLSSFTPEERTFILTFSNKGPLNLEIIVNPYDSLMVNLDESDDKGGIYSKYVKGSSSTCEAVEIAEKGRIIMSHRQLFEGQLYAYADKGEWYLSDLQDSINKCLDEEARLGIDIIKTSKSPANVYSSFFGKGILNLKADSIAVLRKIAKERFPKCRDIQYLDYKGEYPEASERSVRDSDRLLQIVMARMKIIKRKTDDMNQKKKQLKNEKVDFSLVSIDNKIVTISQLYGKYILIDFWASWCIPCIEGMPLIQRAQSDYQDKLVVCLVSMDRNRNSWAEGIKRHHLENFIHLIAIDEEGYLDPEVSKLEVQLLPANLLLDEKGRIVAKNLRGQELFNTLNKLLNR